MSTAHNYRKRKSAEVNETKDDELNGKPKRMGCVAQEKDTAQTPDSSQMTIKQEPGALVPAEEHAAALERIKHLGELNEKLPKEIKESRVNNQQSVEVVAESSQTSPKEVVIPLRKRRDRMAKEDRMKIISKMPFLIEQLNPEHLISTMFSKFLICEDEADELRTTFSTKGRKICAENMLYMLIRCGPYAYKIFLKCLELTGYRKVIEELEPNCEMYEGNIKYPGHQYYELIDNKNPKRKEFIKKAEVDLEEIYESTELVVITKLTKGCVQVTFHLISLGSKNENELREVLESKVKSGYIGDSKVSTEGFSFKKIEKVKSISIDKVDKGDVDILTPLEWMKSGLMQFVKHKKDPKKQETKNISTGFSAHTSQSCSQSLARKSYQSVPPLPGCSQSLPRIQYELVQRLPGCSQSLPRIQYELVQRLPEAERLDQDKNTTLLTKDDDQDKDRVEKGAGYQRKIEQIISNLVTRHPDKLRQLVKLLKDKGGIDDDDSEQIIMCIDREDIKMAARILTSTLTSRPNSYQCFVESVKQLGLSDVEAMLDKGEY